MSIHDASPAGQNDRLAGRLMSPAFPKTRNCLWDKTSKGQATFLHLGHYRKPRICVPEKILKLVQHQCENYGQGSHVLIGSLVVDADGEGVQIQVDRLDTRTNVPLSSVDLSVGGVAISFQVTNNAACERTASADAYVHALKHLQSRCCSKDSIDLCEFIYLCGYASFYSNTHTTVAHLDFDLLTLGTVFKSTPITPVPVAVTALSKNLATPRNLSTLQGTPKSGYLTMDNTRKVMLVLESDPKCSSLPIVGIWVSGVEFLHHPFLWAACLRYIHCTHLQDRVCAPPEEFLLALYRPLQTRPEFYQCATSSGDSCLQFGLNTGHETINMDKMLARPGNGDFVEVEMDPVQDGQKREVFEAAKEEHSNRVAVKNAGFNGQEDLEPRCAPMPHAEKVPVFRPVVPEVSVLWTDSYEHVTSPAPVPRNNEFVSQQNQPVGSQVELLQKQCYPLENFSRQHFTTPANRQHPSGHYHQPQVLHTRPPLSYQYSPARQHLEAAVPNFQQWLPQSTPAPHSRHQFYVNGDGSSPSTLTAGPQVYTTNPQHTSPHHTTIPGPPHHFTSPTSQASQPIPPYHMISSSKMNYEGSVTGSSSHNRNQHLGTPALAHIHSQGIPFPEFVGNYNIHDPNTHNLNGYNSPNLNSTIPQHVNHSQFINPSVAKGGQQSGIQCPEVHPQAHIVTGHSGNLNPPVVLASHPHQPSSSKGLQHHKESLKTIHEESSFSQTLLQHQEPPSARISEVNDHSNNAGSNSSSLRLPSINSSVRSSAEDSGLDASSYRLNISLPRHGADSLAPADSHSALTRTSTCACSSASCTPPNPVESIKWDQVPPEVMSVLVHQNELLKQLQQQIQVLKSEIAQTNKASPPDLGSATSRNQHKTSVAVNTSFMNDPTATSQDHYDSKSTQVTPVRHGSRQQEFSSPATSGQQKDTPKSVQLPAEAGQTPAGHHITAAVSSVGQLLHQSQQGSSRCVQKDASQREFDKDVSSMHSFEHTVNTNLSETECVSFFDRSQSDRSPSSASEYNRAVQESYSTVSGDASETKQLLCQIATNIAKFLEHGEGQIDPASPMPVASKPETIPTQQWSPTKLQNAATGSCADPEAGFVTMHSVFGTDPSQTMEMNALAMKYLSDEQLATVAKLRQTAPSKSHSSAYSAKILEQVMNRCTSSMAGNMSMTDVSQFGMSPCDMTIDTLMYLQKHGLMGNDRSTTLGVSMLGNDLKLRTDFSILTNGSDSGRINFSTEAMNHEVQFLKLRVDPEVSSDPVLSPTRPEAQAHANNENWQPVKGKSMDGQKGMGASAVLPTSRNGQQGYADGDQYKVQSNNRRRNVLQEVTPQAFVNVKTGDHFSPLVKAWSEEEAGEKHSLDLETLKQLPKFL